MSTNIRFVKTNQPLYIICKKTYSSFCRVTVIDMGQANILSNVLFFRVLGLTSGSKSYRTLSRSTSVYTFSKSQLAFSTRLSGWLRSHLSGKVNAIQQSLADITTEWFLTDQVHHFPTRLNKILDHVFSSNPTLVKSSIFVPGISDHDMAVTSADTKHGVEI